MQVHSKIGRVLFEGLSRPAFCRNKARTPHLRCLNLEMLDIAMDIASVFRMQILPYNAT